MNEIPRIGLGTYRSTNKEETISAIKYAINECGYRHIDTAYCYKNEDIIGEALKQVFSEGKIKRNEIWVTTKLWNTYHEPERIEAQFLKQLSLLQLEYVDLFLVHWPIAQPYSEDDDLFPKDSTGKLLTKNVDIIDVWKVFEEIHRKKLARHIGVSNFTIAMLERMKYSDKVTIQPYVNQVEMHVWLQQKALIKYCESNNIKITAYCPIGRGYQAGPDGKGLFEDEKFLSIVKETGKTAAQVALKFLLSLSDVVSVIPKSITPSRIKENFDLQFDLTSSQQERLKNLDRYFHFVNPIRNFGFDAFFIGQS